MSNQEKRQIIAGTIIMLFGIIGMEWTKANFAGLAITLMGFYLITKT